MKPFLKLLRIKNWKLTAEPFLTELGKNLPPSCLRPVKKKSTEAEFKEFVRGLNLRRSSNMVDST